MLLGQEPIEQIVTVTLHASIDRLMRVPGLRLGGHLCGKSLARIPAGKGVNVSRTLGLLGVPSVATGFVGRDELALYESSFAGTSTQAQLLAVNGATRENVTLMDPEANSETHIRDEGSAVSPEDLARLRNKLNLLLKPGSVMVVAGSLPPGLSADDARGLVELALAKKARVVVDSGGAVLRKIKDCRWSLIKPNTSELMAMRERGDGQQVATAGVEAAAASDAATADEGAVSDEEILQAGRSLATESPVAGARETESTEAEDRLVMVSRGAAGGYLIAKDRAWMGQVPVDAGAVRSSVGCGDAMLGGFLAASYRGLALVECYRYAMAVATAAALHETPGQIELNQVDDLLQATEIVPVG